jgi:hypothetical protein
MPEVSRQLLEDAAGYVVYGYDGRRLGTVIELVTGGAGRGDSVAIRRDRIFLWRRRTLPVAAVASIDPQERTVTLSLDSTGIERAHDRHAEEIRQGSIADLIAPYADAPTPQTTAQTHDADGASGEHRTRRRRRTRRGSSRRTLAVRSNHGRIPADRARGFATAARRNTGVVRPSRPLPGRQARTVAASRRPAAVRLPRPHRLSAPNGLGLSQDSRATLKATSVVGPRVICAPA